MTAVRRCAALLCLWVVAMAPAAARDIHYGAVVDPAILECDRSHWRGDIETSRLCYANLLRDDVAAATKAEAAWALNNLQQSNEWFRAALAEAPDDYRSKVRWGDLFAASHQDAEAMNIYREVLEKDPTNAFALLGAARVLVGSFEEAANNYLEPLMMGAVPDNGAMIGALLLVAQVSLEGGNYDEADEALDQAAQLIEDEGWPPLEVYALRAAQDLLNNTDGSRWTEQAIAYNPRFGGIYATPAHFYVITRRYRDAIDLYQKAVDIEPELASAHENMGINLLRDNQVTRARMHLERAYQLDPFSPRSVNSLRLLDSFSNFRLIEDRPTLDGDVPIILRLHKDEADVIAPYAIELTRDSIEVFTERYGFALREPVIIEMYPDHDDFAVRTAGMPGLGILGAAFGYLLAMDSPSGRPPQEFQWGSVLWHELAHVFTLNATDHLVPRWYSEGISVFEEWRSGPNPGVRIPMSVYNAMREDRFLPVSELDNGFMRPSFPEQVIVSYMQAGLVCDFIDREHGEHKLRELLDAFGDGLDTEQALGAVFGMDPGEFDDEFDAFVAAEFGEFLEQLDHWAHTQAEISARLDSGDWETVIDLANELLGIMPHYTEPDSPYLAVARAYNELDQRDAALEALEEFWRGGGYDPAALNRLADWLVEDGQPDMAIEVLQSINLVDPLDADLHGRLGDLLLEADRGAEALQEYEVALALRPHDMATAWYRLASAQHALGNDQQSQDYLLQALDIAPNFRPAQRLLLKLASGADET
ncbi:MAG: tetratricopeptide repeat protein [Woeseiaceae bacterium]|nr:tetratricopeptide repeat protein [Woeseiaceae bacterium]